ncbi:MAG TPA: short-chain dehydrogenase [Cryomorphaceae bacterium]|nr:short-chain dehydrogenase [Owenweeksia sp.]MBG00416.1 short-chain dehydrogenase [Owenweeksia sp.]HAD96690.1 short-chain dehydrogenase [Cryomorphaceae bacterium]|tara:strand:- start:401 stop:1078 length:678 start_codon:yes stop_codon:yes gene_type:complete
MKNIVITGASKGIGFATALEFNRQGHKVLALARNLELLEDLKERSEGNVIIKQHDLTQAVDTLYISKELGEVDVVIHNAGYLVNKPFPEISREELLRTYEVNVFAPFQLTQQLLPLLSKEAHIIMISSIGGVTGSQKFPGLTAYSSSKAAQGSLAEILQAEYAETDLTFNTLALGAVQTEMLEAAFPSYKALVSPQNMAQYIVNFALTAPQVIRGKTISVSRTNP